MSFFGYDLDAWFRFMRFTFNNSEYDKYFDLDTVEGQTIATLAAEAESENANPDYTMIGQSGMDTLTSTFEASVAAGSVWQVWAAATMMGPAIAPNLLRCREIALELYRDEARAAVLDQFCKLFMALDTSGQLRAMAAMEPYGITFNTDDFSGFVAEKRRILSMMQQSTNNPIILSGDMHDAYGWVLYEDGNRTGEPVAVNLVTPGVTSPGWAPTVELIFTIPFFGSRDESYRFLEAHLTTFNPGLVYSNVQHNGFFVVKATRDYHVTEYFHIKDILEPYDQARQSSGTLTADFYCGASLVTTAGKRGSLEPQDECSAIEFETSSRPAVWELPVPILPFPSVEDGDPILVDCGMSGCPYDIDDPESFIQFPTPSPTVTASPTTSPPAETESPISFTNLAFLVAGGTVGAATAAILLAQLCSSSPQG